MSNENKITVLGLTFNSEEERRTYFREELRKKLPELKLMEGFPIGDDEDILNLSDPPYYTACPNPWLNDFIAEWEEEKKELEKQGLRKADFEVTEPYAADVSEGKNNPIYMAHSYHTKVPHPAIMRYILHYTQPGDIVFDGFAGTGMTGVAISRCNKPEVSEKIQIENEWIFNKPKDILRWGKRKSVLNDLSPIASFISYNYNSKFDLEKFLNQASFILDELERENGWMYEVKHTKNVIGKINYTIWSEVFGCPTCNEEIVFWDNAVSKDKKEQYEQFNCPNCKRDLDKKALNKVFATSVDLVSNKVVKKTKTIPVVINYSVGNKRYERIPTKEDYEVLERVQRLPVNKKYIPNIEIGLGDKTGEPRRMGYQNVYDLFTDRNLKALSSLLSRINFTDRIGLLFTSIILNSSRLYRWRANGKGGYLNGTLYIASLTQENNVFKLLKEKIKDLKFDISQTNLVQLGSADNIQLNNNTIDYIFTDPPFGANLMYSELNLITEGWLKVLTDPNREAIENKTQKKTTSSYNQLMTDCFKEFFRILKPGRWMTVEFSNTNSSIWNGIQTALQKAGFVIANITGIDKKQGSYNSVTNATSVKQDLIISCYKPSSEFDQKFNQHKHSDVGVLEFVAEHLEHLPIHLVSGNSTTAIIERSPKILFDRLIAFYVQRGLPVPIDAGKFQQGLRERFIERDGMFFTNEQVQEYDSKKAAVPNFVQLSIFVANEQDAIYWLRHILEKEPKTEQDLHPLWMKEVAGNMRKGDTLPEMRTILEENFLKNDKGQWYLPDPENEADLEKLRTKRLLKQFETYKTEASKPKGKIKEARVEALRAGFKHCYQEKDFKTIVQIGDRIPNNLLMEDEVLLQFYDIASSRV
jgi:transcription elongation factor Elf1